jgi:Arc/MetJ-type ribon-helix-helix transcriptional regulator
MAAKTALVQHLCATSDLKRPLGGATVVEKMEITLAKDVEDFLQEQVREGVCADASDLINNVLRAVRDQRFSSLTVTPELEAWLLEAADKPATPLTAADFAGIRQRARGHARTSDK